jgi:hypothetical protein
LEWDFGLMKEAAERQLRPTDKGKQKPRFL